MRRAHKKREKLTAKKLKGRLTICPEKRVAALEKKIEGLEGRLLYVERNLGINSLPKKAHKQSGPKPRIPDEILFENRDALIDWLEYEWPELRVLMYSAKAKSTMEFEKALRLTEGPGNLWSPIVREFVNQSGALWNFLRDDRFKKAPSRETVLKALSDKFEDDERRKAANKLPTRQIANAMAGVPSLSWRTSLDKCSRNPSGMFVGKRTEEYFKELHKDSQPIEEVDGRVASEEVPKPD